MANEINVQLTLTTNKGALSDQATGSAQVTMSGAHQSAAAQTIDNATPTALGISAGVATLGWAHFRNLDATNWVEVGTYVGGTFYPAVRMKPGEPACFRLSPGKTYYAQANAAPVVLYWKVNED